MRRCTNNIVVVVSSLACIVATGAASAAPMFEGLGYLPGAPSTYYDYSVARAVSADGSTIVGASDAAIDGRAAFRWTADEGMQALGSSWRQYFGATAVSGDGAAVAGWGGNDTYYWSDRAFRWTSGGGIQDLGTLPGHTRAEAHGISGDGAVVVGVSESFTAAARGFRWTAYGGMTDLGHLRGADSSSANAISGDGSTIVGESGSATTSEAFRWTAAGGMEGLGTLPGGAHSSASAVSTDGSTIVGTSDSADGPRAFRWTAAEGMQSLGILPGDSRSFALAVSGDGLTVVGYTWQRVDSGGSYPDGERGTGTAFVWSATSGMRSLRDVLVEDCGVDQYWGDTFAAGISADGLTIVGGGHPGELDVEAFIAVIPERAALPLLALGVGALRCMMRSRSTRSRDPQERPTTSRGRLLRNGSPSHQSPLPQALSPSGGGS